MTKRDLDERFKTLNLSVKTSSVFSLLETLKRLREGGDFVRGKVHDTQAGGPFWSRVVPPVIRCQ